MVLNVIGVAYYVGLWFEGSAWRSFYHILQASRIVVLWNVLHLLGSTSSGKTLKADGAIGGVKQVGVTPWSARR